MAERLVYGNNAHLYSSLKFVYDSGTVTTTEYKDDGSVDTTEVGKYGPSGRIATSVNRHFGSEGTEWRNTYKYVQFDASGNWIKRTGVYELFENGKLDSSSNFTDLRTITCYR